MPPRMRSRQVWGPQGDARRLALGAAVGAVFIAWGVHLQLSEPPAPPVEGATATTTATAAAPTPSAVSTPADLPPRGAAAPDAPNLLLITLCSVRADRLGAWGYAGAHTPTLDALAQDGVRFANAWSPATFTLPSHAAMLTGRLPGHVGVLTPEDVLPAAVDTLPEILRLYGYTTFAWSPVASRASFRAGDGLEQGFDQFKSGETANFGALLGDVRTPWFALVHFKEAHRPYDMKFDRVAPVFRQWNQMLRDPGSGNADALISAALTDPTVRGQLDAAYDGQLTKVDAHVRRVLDAVRARGDADHTIVIVVGDHGESLGEGGFVGHQGRLTPEVLHVPMIIHGAGQGIVRADVSLVDLLPTLLTLGKGVVPAALDGRDLGPALAGAALPAHPLFAQADPMPGDRRPPDAMVLDGDDWLTHGRRDVLLHRDGGTWQPAEDAARAAALRTLLDATLGDAANRATRPATPAERAALQTQGYF